MTQKYAKMTMDEGEERVGSDWFARPYWWVLNAQGQRVGFVYQKPLSRAGSKWRDTGAAAAWCAETVLWQHCHNGEHRYFATKSQAAAALLQVAKEEAQ